MYYVIQVQTSKEDRMIEEIKRHLSDDVLIDVFTPLYVQRKKIKGEWVDVEKPAFPGYIFIETDNIKEVFHGNVSMPFYYYAKNITVALSVLAFVSFVFVLIITGLVIANICLKNKRIISKIIHVLFYVLGAIFIACIVVALCMKHGRILRVYCSGNPQCSMQTLIFFQAILSIGLGIVYSVFLRKYKD